MQGSFALLLGLLGCVLWFIGRAFIFSHLERLVLSLEIVFQQLHSRWTRFHSDLGLVGDTLLALLIRDRDMDLLGIQFSNRFGFVRVRVMDMLQLQSNEIFDSFIDSEL